MNQGRIQGGVQKGPDPCIEINFIWMNLVQVYSQRRVFDGFSPLIENNFFWKILRSFAQIFARTFFTQSTPPLTQKQSNLFFDVQLKVGLKLYF